ncbi:MAG TPA: DUF4129 domain-containing protein [Thermoanaerobaculia bacterium]|nr:DUF4129 domain-containing protein [Thermoanaerobaculia bacterium]
MLVLLLFTISALPLSAATIPIDDYIGRLELIRASLQAGQSEAARAAARDLIGVRVDTPRGGFESDRSLLMAIAGSTPTTHNASTRFIDLETRLTVLIDQLRVSRGDQASAAADLDLLERLRKLESGKALERGGEIVTTTDVDKSMLSRFVDVLKKAGEWIGDKIQDFWDWLQKFWPNTPQPKRQKVVPSVRTPALVTGLVILIVAVLAVLAMEVIRRSRRKSAADQVTGSSATWSKRDDDPMSRETGEWERYAGELAAAGRLREAIRAWYHAVLVALYTSGILHFRKGRTNWEYVSLLGPDLVWRPSFIQLTRRFEQEWYGCEQSSIDALDTCSSEARRILGSLGSRRGAA